MLGALKAAKPPRKGPKAPEDALKHLKNDPIEATRPFLKRAEIGKAGFLTRQNPPRNITPYPEVPCTETDPAKLWRWYIQLTQAEAAFRTAKSDLKLRPIYHQKTERVEAHILVCFLALAQWRVLEQWMSGKGLGTCAMKLVAEISTIKSMDVIIPVKRGETIAELTVRTVARPERRLAELFTRLDLELPTRNRILGEVPAGVAANAAASKM